MKMRQEIHKRAKKGETLAAIGADYGITRQRVHQILKEMDPEWSTPREPVRKEIVTKSCPVCGGELGYRRKKFCSTEHFEAMREFTKLTEQYETIRRKMANYCLRNIEKVHPAAVGWAQKVQEGELPVQRRFIHRDSVVYQKLERAGLAEKLPAEIQVLD